MGPQVRGSLPQATGAVRRCLARHNASAAPQAFLCISGTACACLSLAGVPSNKVKTARWYCNAGYYTTSVSIPNTRSCSMSTGSWGGSGTGCSACGAGYYCPGGSSSRTRTQCPAGTWARSTDTTLSSSACSGNCAQGYFCAAGSTSPTAVRQRERSPVRNASSCAAAAARKRFTAP